MVVSTVPWAGEVCFGETLAAYVGRAAHNDLHAHVAYQVVLADEPFAVESADGRLESDAVIIRTLARHALIAEHDVRMIYVEPTSGLAKRLAEALGTADVATLPEHVLPPLGKSDARALVSALRPHDAVARGTLDHRLDTVLERLRTATPASLAEAARAVGLSPSRLRAIAAEELGVPLSTWILWRKLERATRAMFEGVAPSRAALEGGFADQAHFTRTMRRMFGITPRVVNDGVEHAQ